MRYKQFNRAVLELGKAVTTASLCALMVAPQAWAETPLPSAPPARTAPLTQNEKDLHLLNRMTFGPRPGDEAMVKKMGLREWFAWQLHPDRIPDTALDDRLAEFPALQLSSGEMLAKYPSRNRIRQIARSGASLPSDPIEHAIYADSIAFDRKAQEVLAKGNPPATPFNADAAVNQAPAIDKAKGISKGIDVPRMAPAERENLLAMEPQQRFQALVGMQPEQMVSLRRGMRPPQQMQLVQGLTPEQKQDVIAMEGGERLIGDEALGERILRDVYSQRQVQAVMDDFWLNHFSVYVRKNQNEPYYLASYDRYAILPNALGSFEKLLVATAESPAMLMYLDNWQSIGPDSPAAQRGKRIAQFAPNTKPAQAMPKGINENYARELMELHTLGVGGGYTQADVINVARCFTGWTIAQPYGRGRGRRFQQQDAAVGTFIFEPNRHEGGPKTVLGHIIPEGGINEGLEVLHILATSPVTAHFVSNKLAVRFVSDTPPPALVDRMAATFLRTDGDIRAVLTTMVDSPEFYSPAVYRAKVKTPIEFMVSALRASDAEISSPLALVQAMNGLGMPIYGMQTPNGYSWQSENWVSSNALVARMNFALVLSGSRIPGASIQWPSVLDDNSSAPTPRTEAELETVVLGEPAGAHTRQTVLANYNDPTVQQQAAAGFSKTSQQAEGPAAAPSADDGMALSQMHAGFSKKAAKSGGLYLLDKPQLPLDTMAGLLIGSPDFQKR